MTVNLIEISLLMSSQLHHTCQILVFIVTAIQLQLTVATDEHKRRTVLAHPVERCPFVDGGLQGTNALHLSHIVMGDGLTAERYIKHHGVGILAVTG